MSKFNKVRLYYESKVWNKNRVSLAVRKGWITKEEYKEITGTEYTEVKP